MKWDSNQFCQEGFEWLKMQASPIANNETQDGLATVSWVKPHVKLATKDAMLAAHSFHQKQKMLMTFREFNPELYDSIKINCPLISADDERMWAWLDGIPNRIISADMLYEFSERTVRMVTDVHKLLVYLNRPWELGMIHSDGSLYRVYMRLKESIDTLPTPPYSERPGIIEAIKSYGELSTWGEKQRNDSKRLVVYCIAREMAVYRMLWPAEGTVVIDLNGPRLSHVEGSENGRINKAQLDLLLEWCSENQICCRFWFENNLDFPT